MRVVSADGRTDLPYEETAFSVIRDGEGVTIAAYFCKQMFVMKNCVTVEDAVRKLEEARAQAAMIKLWSISDRAQGFAPSMHYQF